jgi:hypothetical protein
MSTASLAFDGTGEALAGPLVHDGLDHFVFRQKDHVITPRFAAA